MKLKENVNKVHSSLQSIFNDVKIVEKSDLKFGSYIELSITEGNVNLIAKISKSNLEFDKFNWIYLSNPTDETSLVERNSSVDTFTDDVKDIFNKNRFDSEYLQNLN
jgi:hypothetical protein